MRGWTAKSVAGGTLAAAVAVLASCAEPPGWEAGRARAAFQDLAAAGAADYAPDPYRSAEAALRDAEAELASQNARFTPWRDYAKAAELFKLARADAEAARLEAEEGRRGAEKEAREAADAAEAAVDNARATLLVAPVGRDGRSAAVRLDEGLSTAHDRLQVVRNHLVAGEYKQALAGAEEIQEEVARLLHAVGRSARRQGF
ncbi:MAG TPA: hypothetical protein VJV23_02670 [Candidatus Polarisedimenticolia bacterium]|nr:hypothetical protein [Candidatus Polarisedimenticolia bacterium]